MLPADRGRLKHLRRSDVISTRIVTSPRAGGSARRSGGGWRTAAPSCRVFSPAIREGWSSHRCAVALLAECIAVGAVRDLLQRRDQARRVAREHRSLRVGEVLAVARDRQLDHLADERRERHQREPHREQDQRRPPPPFESLPRRPPIPPHHQRAHEELREQHDGADQGRDDRAVAGCRGRRTCAISWPITPSSSTRFIVVQQALGHGDRRVLGVAAGRERVRRLLGHHVDARLRHAGRDREPLDDVVQARLVRRRVTARARAEASTSLSP